ncbi:cilia- and flagella-associated protein 20-like [Amyelois transitella]|uniref:cilia- and flagella-associated protein 20-like n=1 Tax=Amyelois transitella TaxID=680683 RepID=UPI00299026B3|nr:cilia- and flagella-associated protein 20-like [Amyelois transitella]
MFKNTYQNGLLSIFYSCGSNPLAIWDMEVNNGHIKRLTDSEVNSIVLEIVSTNVATTYISCPRGNQVLDDKHMRRRFRISNFQSTTKIKPFCTTMPIGLAGGWNQIQFNLSDFTRRAYGTQFLETLRVQIHANARLRRIYFAERLYTEEELPQDYKLYLPLDHKHKKGKAEKKEAASPAAAKTPPTKAAPAAPTPPPVEEAPPPPPPEATPPPVETPPPELQADADAKESEVTETPASTEAGDEKPPEMEGEAEAPPEGEPIEQITEEKAEAEVEEQPVGGDETPLEAEAAEAAEAPPE